MDSFQFKIHIAMHAKRVVVSREAAPMTSWPLTQLQWYSRFFPMALSTN